MTNPTPDREVTLDDILAATRGADEVSLEGFPQVHQARPQDTPQRSAGRFFGLAIKQDWIPYSAARLAVDAGIELDESFDLETSVPEKEFAELTEGLDEEAKQNIAEAARSRSHLYFLTSIAKESQRNEEELAAYGGWGMVGRFGAGMLDPGTYALAFATGGLGIGTKAERMANTARTAATFAERRAAVGAMDSTIAAGHSANVLSVGVAAGLENAAIEALSMQTDATRDGWDVALAGLTGLGIGSAAGRLLSGRELNKLRTEAGHARRALEVEELRAEVGARRVALNAELGDVAAARSEDLALSGRVGSFVAGRDADMADYGSFAVVLESGGRADAKAKTSSATGLHQFIGTTWLGYVRKLKPAWAEGKTEAEILSLRTDPQASKEIFDAYTADNVAALRRAGAPVNPFTAYAAHHFGPNKGVTFAKAPDTARMEDILTSAQLDANPYLKGKTKAEAITTWVDRARRQGVDLGNVVARIPEGSADALRAARAAEVDSDAASARLKELEGTPPARTAGDAAGRATGATAARVGDDLLSALERPVRGPEVDFEVSQLREALGLKVAHDADTKTRGELRDLLSVSAPRSRSLAKLDALDTLDAAATVRGDALRTGGTVQPLDQQTLSAARTIGYDGGLFARHAEAVESANAPQMNLASAARLLGKGTFAGVLRGSNHAIVRQELGPLVGNALGNVDGSAVQVGASEVASLLTRRMGGKWATAAEPAYSAWMKERNIGAHRKWSRNVRADFMRELGQHIRGQESDSPAVQAAASRVRSVFAEFLREAKAAGVKGFENVEPRDNWLPRVFDFHALHALKDRVGADQLQTLIARSMRSMHDDLDDAVASKVAGAYIKRLRELRMGNDVGLMQGMSFDDIGFLRQFLGDAGMASDEVEEIVGKFASAKTQGGKSLANQEGSFRHAKARLGLDENFAMDLRDVKANDGTTIRVTVSDLFDSNVETLFGRYSRTMSGHIALARVGIKSRADFSERMQKVAHGLEGSADWEDVQKRATAAYDLITARPLQDSTLWTELLRTGRDFAYASQMENAGLANIPDLASLLSWGNFRYSARSFFNGDVFGAMWKRGTDGRMADELMQEIEETTGLGTDFLNNQVHASYDVADDYAEAITDGHWLSRGVSKVGSNAAHGARVVSRGVTAGSGLAAVTSLAQRMAARNMVYRLKDELFKGGRFSAARMARLGIDDSMRVRIEGQMRKHTEWTKGETGGDIQRVNFVEWDDMDARDAFLYAVHREARKNIQEEDLGDTFYFQHRAIGKVLTQFRRFGITAFTKQTLRGISERDAEAATRALLQMVMAAGVYQARHEIVVQGMEVAGTDPEKIREYRQRNLTGDRLMAAAIRNSGVASLFPDLSDTITGATMDATFFDVRTSGNSSKALAGIPLVAWSSNVSRAASSIVQAAVRGDRQFTQGDARALQAIVPFGNHILTAPAIEALVSDLPKGEGDDDPDSIKWIWQ